jgi:tetratricopeptide (TPR) repeat protein
MRGFRSFRPFRCHGRTLLVIGAALVLVGGCAPYPRRAQEALPPGVGPTTPWRGVFELALGLAAEDRPQLQRDETRRLLEALALEVRAARDAQPERPALAVAEAVFGSGGFQSVPDDPQGLARSSFDTDTVLADRRGTCLSIVVIALAACEAAEVRAAPLLSPGHAMLLVEPGVVVDPAVGGVVAGPHMPPGTAGVADPHQPRVVGPDEIAAALLANRATYRRAAGDLEGALLDLERAGAADPQSFTVRLNRAVVLLDARRVAEAVEALEALEQDGLGTSLTAYNLGVAAVRAGTLGVARHWYGVALEREPTMVRAWVNLGAVHLALDQPQEAASQFRAALALEPDNVPARGGLERAEATRR